MFSGWNFFYWDGSKIPRSFKAFQESGILDYLIFVGQFSTARTNRTKVILAQYPERCLAGRRVNPLNIFKPFLSSGP